MKTTVTAVILLLLVGCSSSFTPEPQRPAAVPVAPGGSLVNVERHAFDLAEKNRLAINRVRIGQTFTEVERILGAPERRAARVRYDGLSVEEWSYITDYVRKMDGLILFVGGKVEEIQSTSWDKRIRDEMAQSESNKQ